MKLDIHLNRDDEFTAKAMHFPNSVPDFFTLTIGNMDTQFDFYLTREQMLAIASQCSNAVMMADLMQEPKGVAPIEATYTATDEGVAAASVVRCELCNVVVRLVDDPAYRVWKHLDADDEPTWYGCDVANNNSNFTGFATVNGEHRIYPANA